MNKKIRHVVEAYSFLFPSFLLTMVLGIYPILWAIRYMFYNYQGFGEAVFIGLDNFSRLLRDEAFFNAVQNTFVYAGGKLLLTLPFSLFFAVVLNKKLRGNGFFKAIYFMPTVISTAVIAVVFFILFNSYNGIINQLLISSGMIETPIAWLGPDLAMLTNILIAAWGAIGNYMLLFIAGLQGIPDDLYESAELDGANSFQRFRYITIPMLGPVLQMVIMLAIIASLKGYESIMVLTQGGPIGKTDVMYLYVYKMFFPMDANTAFVQEFGYGSAVGFATAVIVGVITLIYFYLSKRLNKLY